jgi:LmbE family N-acetylglucosaminyl deacetylase
MNTLVVAPHPDDETIGCGGTIALSVAAGEKVGAVFLTSGELGLEELPAMEARTIREAEAEEAARILGLASITFLRHRDWFLADCTAEAVKDLTQLIEREAPLRLFFPHPDEWHPDHAATAEIVLQAVEAGGDNELRLQTYEVWTPMSSFDEVEDISAVMGTKLEAVRAYRSQLVKFKYDDAVEGLDRFRGALGGRCRYAEVFGECER